MKLGQNALEYLECKVAIIPEMSTGHLQRDKTGVNYCLLVLWPQDPLHLRPRTKLEIGAMR